MRTRVVVTAVSAAAVIAAAGLLALRAPVGPTVETHPPASAAATPPPASEPATVGPSEAPQPSAGPLAITASSALGSAHSGSFTSATKIPAFGQGVTWRFDGGVALAGQQVQILATDRDFPPDFVQIATATAGPSGTAYYTTSFDRPAYLSVRAFVAATAEHAATYSPSRIASWRGPGPCAVQVSGPADQAGQPESLVPGPGGATYTLRWGWDRAGNEQWTLVASGLSGPLGASWTHVFPACQSAATPVVGSNATAYVLTSDPGSKFTSARLYAFGPAGLRAVQALPGLLGGLVRSNDGTVYLVAEQETARPGSSWAGIWHGSYLAALDAAARPKPGWPYRSAVPASDPSFGADGTVYTTTGFQIGLTGVPAAAQRVHTVVALRPDGTPVPGWPFTLPAGTSPTLTWLTEGNDMVFGQPPTVGADGTVYVVASTGTWGEGGDLVVALSRDGRLKAGWPFATTLGQGGFVIGTGSSPGATPPAIGPDGTVYLVRRAGSISTRHDEVVALAPDGKLRSGWPVALPDHAAPSVTACPASAGFYLGCWLRLASDGQLVVSLYTDRPDVTSPLCLTTDGARATCSPEAIISTPLP
ncbi:MAG TPA: hypothetical protein VNF73_10940 [Candidatus Saccharimonadales bacterium]|nr:hypothetical protein [Candidatus Saccharimonadales bacterium]